MKRFASFILLTVLGWKMDNNLPKNLKKYIVIVAPHTSWVDFPIAILARMVSGIKINYIGKDSLFKGPFGFIFKALGGTPVDRSKNNRLVDSIVDIFNSKEEFRLGLSPEGTRKKVTQWKTGFYYIAKNAKIPIIMIGLDFEKKHIKISNPFKTTDNIEQDFAVFHLFYMDIKGKNPEFS